MKFALPIIAVFSALLLFVPPAFADLGAPGKAPGIFNPGKAAAINPLVKANGLAWDLPTTRAGGGAFNAATELGYFTIKWGSSTGVYTGGSTTVSSSTTFQSIPALHAGTSGQTRYFTVTATDIQSTPQTSGNATEVSTVIQ